MKEELAKAIEKLAAEAATKASSRAPDDAMKFSQAALNLMHAYVMLHNMK